MMWIRLQSQVEETPGKSNHNSRFRKCRKKSHIHRFICHDCGLLVLVVLDIFTHLQLI